MKHASLLLITGFMILSTVTGQKQSLKEQAPSPPMGWNSWNWFQRNVDEDLVKEVIDAMVAEGLRDAGYEFIVIDGGWRDSVLSPEGKLIPDPEKFPGGIKALADLAHSKGLKLGMHTCPGTHDCGHNPVGGFGVEEMHIQQFIDWGIDFIKLDECYYNVNGCGQCWDEELLEQTYRKWRRILDEKNSDIVLAICAYSFRDWNPEVGVMARSTFDIGFGRNIAFNSTDRTNFLAVMDIVDQNNENADNAGDGFWNDPDMLLVGHDGLTPEEQKAHFALWCVMTAPLMLGNDPRNMSDEEKDILLNKEALAIDQDPGEQGRKVELRGDSEIWIKNLGNGDKAVVLLNRDPENRATITLQWDDLGLKGRKKLRDVFEKKDLGRYRNSASFEVGPNSCRFLRIS